MCAQVVQLFDSWASHLAPAQYAQFSLPYAQRVVDGVRAQRPGTPLIFHANGGARPCYQPSYQPYCQFLRHPDFGRYGNGAHAWLHW